MSSGLTPGARRAWLWGGAALLLLVLGPAALDLYFRLCGLPPALERVTQRMLASEWTLLRETLGLLATDEGCRELRRRHPALEQAFPGTSLEELARAHRGRLPAALPEHPDLARGTFRVQSQLVHKTLTFDLDRTWQIELRAKGNRILALSFRELKVVRLGASGGGPVLDAAR